MKKPQATLWGPDAPIINGYQEALEARGFRVTRMEHLPDEFSWVALDLPHIHLGFYRNDDVAKAIENLDPVVGWEDDPLSMES